jgi:hypothetical protein
MLAGAQPGLNPVLEIYNSDCSDPCHYSVIGNGSILCECEFYTHDELIFTNQVSLSNVNYVIKKVLLIESNAKVIFTNSTIRFYKNAKIIVKPGGKLYVDRSTLTNAC